MDEISAAVQVIIRESQDKGIKSKSRHTAVFSGRDVHPLKYPVSVGGGYGSCFCTDQTRQQRHPLYVSPMAAQDGLWIY